MAACCGDNVLVAPLDFRETDDFDETGVCVDPSGASVPFDAGSWFFEFFTEPVHVKWVLSVSGSTMRCLKSWDEVKLIPNRTHYHLKFLPTGTLTGGHTYQVGHVRREC